MSTVVLQVGQCGNQIGSEFWTTVSINKAHLQGHIYVQGDGHLRSVNIDSEPKVLQRLAQSKNLSIRDGNIQKGRRGRGSNWALGYHGTKNKNEDKLLENALEAIRKEIERCSCFCGFLMMHSCSGGTGSGLGSRLVKSLRDDYPLAHIMSSVVAPHVSGESPLQHYNSLLCLASLQRYTDAVMCFHNDKILRRLEKRGAQKSVDSGISIPEMNQHIAQCIAGLVLPTDTLTPASGVSIGQEPWELMRSISPMPSNKFIHINHFNKSKVSWENLTGLLTQGLQKYDGANNPYHSLSNLVVARGDTAGSFPQSWGKVQTKIKAAYSPVNWNPFPVDYWMARSSLVDQRESASLTVASNHSSIADHLRVISDAARLKYNAKAYLHWYHKYGCQQEDFEEAFSVFEDIIESYRSAVT